MALVNLPGQFASPFGPSPFLSPGGAPIAIASSLDAALEACIMIGRVITADGASHTIDTSGSSSIQWRTGNVTFANAGTSVKVGIGAVDAGAGPPGRAVNVTDTITFDVSKTLTGGGGGITNQAWQTHAPDAGSKTIANGDLVALSVQVVTRGGADSVQVRSYSIDTAAHRPGVTEFTGGVYATVTSTPDAIIVFSDGTIGWFFGSTIFDTTNTRTWNSGDATKEYGQLFQLPFPMKVWGIYGWVDPDADLDTVFYSDPLGTPVAEKTIPIDANTVSAAVPRRFMSMFDAPYSVAANQPVVAGYKPGGSNVSAYYRTLNNAAHRITDPWGLSGYGVSRASGAFANANSSLDHYYIGLLASGFDAGGGARIVGG